MAADELITDDQKEPAEELDILKRYTYTNDTTTMRRVLDKLTELDAA